MRYSWQQLQDVRRFRIPVLGRVYAHVRTLPPSDQLIAGVLALLVLISLLAGTYGLSRVFMVRQPAYGGSFTEGVVGHPRFVNPLLALTDADRDLVRLTYAGLMGVGPDGSLMPVLAERYEVSEDGKIYTFVLRADAKFSDNTPVTAEDVVFTVEKAQDTGLKSPELANWAGIQAEAVDARTVRFTLPKAYAPFLEDTTLGILPADKWRGVTNQEFPFSPMMEKPTAAGPFVVERVVRDADGVITEYTLKANPRYALGRPYLDRITLRFFEDDTDLETALRAKRIDSAYGIQTDAAIRVPYARVFGAFLNATENPALGAKEVRQALSIATNRDAITTGVLGGYATAINGPVPPGSGIEVSAPPTPANRVTEAAAILEAADWEYDEEARLWKKGEQVLRVTLRTSNVPELRLIAQQIQSDWAALGIPTALELFEPTDLTQSVIRPRKYDALLFGMVVGRDRDLYAFWHSAERMDPGLNIALYNNPSVDRLLEQYRLTSDPDARLGLLAQLEAQIASDIPAVFTHTPEFVYAAPKFVHGIALTQIASPSDRFASAARWYAYTEDVWPIFARNR